MSQAVWGWVGIQGWWAVLQPCVAVPLPILISGVDSHASVPVFQAERRWKAGEQKLSVSLKKVFVVKLFQTNGKLARTQGIPIYLEGGFKFDPLT